MENENLVLVKKNSPLKTILTVIATLTVLAGIAYLGYKLYQKYLKKPGNSEEEANEDDWFGCDSEETENPVTE